MKVRAEVERFTLKCQPHVNVRADIERFKLKDQLHVNVRTEVERFKLSKFVRRQRRKPKGPATCRMLQNKCCLYVVVQMTERQWLSRDTHLFPTEAPEYDETSFASTIFFSPCVQFERQVVNKKD